MDAKAKPVHIFQAGDENERRIRTLKFVEKLEAGGFTHAQAKAAAEAFAEATSQELVTKSDLKEALAELKVDMVRWLVVTQIALAGVLLAAFKFVR
jgi:hypothetical protein